MWFIEIIISVVFITVILSYLSKKYQILVDQKNISFHKSFVVEKKNTPLLGGLIFILSLIFFLPVDYLYFKIFIFLIFFVGLLSDINLLRSPTIRILFQVSIIISYLLLSNNFVLSVRINFIDELMNIFLIKVFFTLFCLLVLINGTNFIDGVNTSAIGYYLLVFSNIFYLSEINNFNLDKLFLFICLASLFSLYLFNFLGKIFLGDSGSYLIAFVAGIFLIKFSNDNYLVSPYYFVALLWYPAYENLFSIIRKNIIKKSPSTPDTDHLHQLIFLSLNKYFNIGENFSNTMTGFLICLYNFIYFIIIFNSYFYTKTLVYSLFFNVIIYSFLYFFLKKKLIQDKQNG